MIPQMQFSCRSRRSFSRSPELSVSKKCLTICSFFVSTSPMASSREQVRATEFRPLANRGALYSRCAEKVSLPRRFEYDWPASLEGAAMNLSVPISRMFAMLSVCALVGVAAIGTARAQEVHPRAPKSVRLYVFDCGVIKGLDPGLFDFKKEELAETELAVPCYLIVDPRGTLIWDVGVIPDTAFKDDGQPVTQGPSTATRTLKSQLAEIGYAPGDITYLAHSHYHSDHIANSNEFAGSTWLVRPVERDAMFVDKPPALVDPKDY